MNITHIDEYLSLWDANELEKLWDALGTLSHPELAYATAWMTAMIRDDGEVRLSQWLVWLEIKSKNQ
tara:strand:+ start:291 stop:491 length:201 start_codon:yes stop_codon:yes gene_type:complete